MAQTSDQPSRKIDGTTRKGINNILTCIANGSIILS